MEYTIENAKRIFEKSGYFLDTDIYKSISTKMPCHDNNGFKYETCISELKRGRHPKKFHKGNKYTMYNIQKTLDEETDGVKLLSKVYNNSHEKMEYICSCGKKFTMTLNQFVTDKKRYCNFCSKSKRYDGAFDYYSIVKNRCDELGYSLLTKEITRSNQLFEYICNEHNDCGIQKTSYDRMINCNQGCYYCGIIKRSIKHRTNINDIISELDKKGFDYVDHYYDRISENSSSKVRIGCICRKHRDKGKQYLDYGNLKNNKVGCIFCRGYGRTQESLQKEFDEIDSGLEIIEFNKYSDIVVKCKKCGKQWNTKGIYILNGVKCRCNSASKYEKIVKDILSNNNIEYEEQYKFIDCRDKSPLPFDFYLNKKNVAIEVDGQQHYYPVNFGGISDEEAINNYITTTEHDRIKTEYCNKNGILLIRIPFFIFEDENIDINNYILNKI